MATPTTGSLNVIGSAGGMAPFPTSVYADIEGVGSTWATGSGFWAEGRWAFQLMDNATGQVYDSGLMDLQCPNSSVTATAYNRYGAAPIAGCVVFDPGTYYWRVRYQNRDGDWSSWVNSSTFTVAANTRTKLYVDGNAADDSGDGLTHATAKKSLDAGLALIDGPDYEVVVKDDTTIDCNNPTNLNGFSGVYIHRSGDGAGKPKIVLKQSGGQAMICYDNTVVDGLEIEYDGVLRRNVFTTSGADQNIAWMNIDTHEIQSLAEFQAGKDYDGIIFYGCTMIENCSRYMIFGGGGNRVNVLNCDWQKGSTDEHVIRITWTIAGGVDSSFYSFDFSKFSYANGELVKSVLRAYARRFLGSYRCTYDGGNVSVGNIDIGDIEDSFRDYRFDCCRFNFDPDVARNSQQFEIFERSSEVVLASCLLYRSNPNGNSIIRFRQRASGDVGTIENVRILGCSFYHDDSAENVGHLNAISTISDANVLSVQVRGSLFQSIDSAWTLSYANVITLPAGPTAGCEIRDNVFFEHSTLAIDLVDEGINDYETVVALNAQSWASGNVFENLAINQTTGEPSGGTAYQSVVYDITGIFETLNGESLDRDAVSWAAGAWHPVGSGAGIAGAPASSYSYLGLTAGGSYIVLQT